VSIKTLKYLLNHILEKFSEQKMVLHNNVQIPEEGVRLQVQNIHLFIENTDYGKGILCVSER
jgi:hypothetical protein